MVTIDSHQHVWDLTRARYDWLKAEHSPIDRTIAFDSSRPSLRRAGIQSTVLVQSADNDEDTEFMLEVARANPEIAAVVAFVPLDDPERAASRLDELRRDPLVVGVRNLTHDSPDPDFILRPDVDDGLGVLEAAGVAFDYLAVLPRHLEHLDTISERHPRLRIVIDHLAKPPIGSADREPWWSLIERAAQNPLVFGKVSGLYSVTGSIQDWTPDLVRPFFDRALETFGAARLMYGGDWPVSVLAGGYERVWAGLSEVFERLDPGDRQQILGGTAESFYRINPVLLSRAVRASAVPAA
jgi:L-fuconolactonase